MSYIYTIANLQKTNCPTSSDAFMFDHFHWLPLIVRPNSTHGFHIDLPLTITSHIGQTPNYLCHFIPLPSSAISLGPLRSSDWHDLFVPRARTSMAQKRAFAIVGSALCGTNSLLRHDPPY